MSENYIVGKKYIIHDENYYFIEYHHYKRLDKHKSQWLVPLAVEADLFDFSLSLDFTRHSQTAKKAFSYYLINDTLTSIGFDTQGRPAYISCFETNYNPNHEWHGYPVNHMEIRPSLFDNSVIDQWQDSGLPIHYVRKLKTGKKI